MIDIKVQEVFAFLNGEEIIWRDTIIENIKYYYAENQTYIFRIPNGDNYVYTAITHISLKHATYALAGFEYKIVDHSGVGFAGATKNLFMNDEERKKFNKEIAATVSESKEAAE